MATYYQAPTVVSQPSPAPILGGALAGGLIGGVLGGGTGALIGGLGGATIGGLAGGSFGPRTTYVQPGVYRTVGPSVIYR